jgi:hypothetical protein
VRAGGTAAASASSFAASRPTAMTSAPASASACAAASPLVLVAPAMSTVRPRTPSGIAPRDARGRRDDVPHLLVERLEEHRQGNSSSSTASV